MRDIPDERALLITSGVDVQQNRLVCVIRAWGPGEENWLLWFSEIFGDPNQELVWNALHDVLEHTFQHPAGIELKIVSMAIDASYLTQEVYNFCRRRFPRVIPIRGQSQSGKPVIGRPTWQDVTWQGIKIENGVQLWPVGTDTAKSTIYGRLKMETPGPGYYHFPIGLPDDYFQQLTAEKLVTRYSKGYPIMEWVKVRPRNDALDTEVYCYAAAIRAGLNRIDWNQFLKDLKGEKRKSSEKSEKFKRQEGWLSSNRGSWLKR